MTLPNQPTMPLSTARASAPTAVVSLLTAVRLHPALTSVNHPHLIVALQLSKLLPTRFPTRPTLLFDEQIANRPCKTHSSPASAAPAASYKSPYRKCAGVMLHRLTRRFRAGALVDRELSPSFPHDRPWTTTENVRPSPAQLVDVPCIPLSCPARRHRMLGSEGEFEPQPVI